MKKKKKFTKEYEEAQWEEVIYWSDGTPESVKKQFYPLRRFSTWKDLKKGIPVKPYK